MTALSHLDGDGRARMVDVSDKAVTERTARAGGRLVTTAEVVRLVRAEGLPKADVLATARIAGIAGAKRTADLIPLCHPLPLTSVTVDFALEDDEIVIEATARTTGRTGVEMEALTAVTVAGLTLHDMVKAVDPAATLTDVRLLEKTGGRRGHWTRDTHSPEPIERRDGAQAPATGPGTALVLVASTRAAEGVRTDTTGPVIVEWLASRGLSVDEPVVVPDSGIDAALREGLATRPALIITTGGTGVSPTDRTPEATAAVLDRPLPGLADALRRRGEGAVPTSVLSRGLAGVARGTVVVNLPGSPGGVRDGLSVLDGVLDHLLDQVATGGGHRG